MPRAHGQIMLNNIERQKTSAAWIRKWTHNRDILKDMSKQKCIEIRNVARFQDKSGGSEELPTIPRTNKHSRSQKIKW